MAPCPAPPDADNAHKKLRGTYGAKANGGNGRYRFVVEVADYMTLAPLRGVEVTALHDSGPCTRNAGCKPMHDHPARLLRITAKTDRNGRAVIEVPDLNYQHTIAAVPAGYLAYSSIYRLGARQCHDIEIHAAGVDSGTRYIMTYLMPESMLRVTKQDQAVGLAEAIPEIQTWLPTHTHYQLHVEGGPPSSPTMWEVAWGTTDRLKRLVYVNAFDGTATVNGRWTD